MQIYYLTDTWPWFGKHQCYSRLVDYIRRLDSSVQEIPLKYNLSSKIIGRFYSILRGDFTRKDSVFADAERRFISAFDKKSADSIYHILFYDTHYRVFNYLKEIPRNIIATIHHPIGREYPVGMEANLRKLSSAIVMYKEGVEHFERYIGKDRVKFIHYGVDTDFFKPPSSMPQAPCPTRLFFTGQNGRNIDMLKRVISKLAKRYPDIGFDILVPEALKKGSLKELIDHPAIQWHSNLSEVEVRKLYQRSYLLLMPMQDSGVNSAIVEALACGVPVITTDVGGVRDYGAGTVYPVVDNNDDNAMVDLVEKYIAESSWRDEVAKNCRAFAEHNLAWSLIAEKHLEAYRELNV